MSRPRFEIDDRYWTPRLELSREKSIPHQWDQLNRVGAIENLKLAAALRGSAPAGRDGAPAHAVRRGYCYADSDIYKWYESVAREYARRPSEALRAGIDEVRRLVSEAMEPDGYIHSFNQIVTPGERWVNLLIEHELYNHGHLIEALVADNEATGDDEPLQLARRVADQIVDAFGPGTSRPGAKGHDTSGHQEIELALLKLAGVTGDDRYRRMAVSFLDRRRWSPGLIPRLLRQSADQTRRQRLQDEGTVWEFDFGDGSVTKAQARRFKLQTIMGRYHQLRRWRGMRKPIGHAVRFGYEMIALSMLARGTRDDTTGDPRGDTRRRARRAVTRLWNRLVERHLYVTGGIGALPVVEGFGRDYELPTDTAYCETCASIALVLWSRELSALDGDARYADLIEWVLYNATGSGLGSDGTTYSYQNPLESDGSYHRQSWFPTACCPANLSRLTAQIGSLVVREDERVISIEQYIGGSFHGTNSDVEIAITSSLPASGDVEIAVNCETEDEWTLRLRIPSWCRGAEVSVDGEPISPPVEVTVGGNGAPGAEQSMPGVSTATTASGYDPRLARSVDIRREWTGRHVVTLRLPMPVTIRTSHPRVRATRGRYAVTRGPVLYCLEAADNPGIDFDAVRLDPTVVPESAETQERHDRAPLVRATSAAGVELTLIPYAEWAGRNDTRMRVWL